MDYHHISANLVDGVTVVRFQNLAKAVHSEAAIHEIGYELQGLLDEVQPSALILDFENKEFLPFAAFDGILVRLQRKVTQRNGILKLCNLPPVVIQLLKINRLADYFSLCNSLEDALAATIDQKPLHSDSSGDDS
jgi:anti-anti-sigma regulatory factor